MTGKPHMHSQYKNAYSSTGFDMLGVLVRSIALYRHKCLEADARTDARRDSTKPGD
jgi:hypothetical protein